MKLTKQKLKEMVRTELLNEDDEIYVRGIGKYSYDTLKKNIERKVKDLVKRNKKGNHTGLGEGALKTFTVMWLALAEYEENQ